MHIHRNGLASFATALALLVCGSAIPARAAETAEAPKGWEFDIVPYLWTAGLSGDVKIGRLPTQGIEASFGDILDHLEIAGMLAFGARKDDWGVLVDAIYIDLGDTVAAANPTFGEADVSMTEQLYSALVTYRIHDGKKTTVDMAWGGRYYRIDADFELVSGIAVGRAASADVSWWDWLAGCRFVGRPSKRWSLTAYADIGGGGSELTSEAIVGADFAFNKTVSLAFGYRYLYIDYDENAFLYRTAMHGPFVGVGFHF